MKILTVNAHPDHKSYCHAVSRKFASWLPDGDAPDVVEIVVKERVFARDAGLLQRMVAWSKFRNKTSLEAMLRLGGCWMSFAFSTLEFPGSSTSLFYAVNMADEETLRGCLERGYRLGKEFSR